MNPAALALLAAAFGFLAGVITGVFLKTRDEQEPPGADGNDMVDVPVPDWGFRVVDGGER